MPEPIAVFTRDGVTRNAYTRADIVQFKFDGWQQADPSTESAGSPAVTVGPPVSPLDLDDADESGDES